MRWKSNMTKAKSTVSGNDVPTNALQRSDFGTKV